MGLEVCHILSEERHYGCFICVICQNLVDLDGVVTTSCSHCFCRPCLQQWLDRTSALGGVYRGGRASICQCPTCNEDLLHNNNNNKSQSSGGNNNLSYMVMRSMAVNVQPIQSCQPLAYRVLNRVQVCCPLQGVQCEWKGDYGNLHDHLLSKTSHDIHNEHSTIQIRPPPQQTKTGNNPSSSSAASQSSSSRNSTRTAEEKENRRKNEPQQDQRTRIYGLSFSYKEEANGKFTSGYHKEARDLYTQAINLLLPVYIQADDDDDDEDEDDDDDDDDENTETNTNHHCSQPTASTASKNNRSSTSSNGTTKETVKSLLATLYSNRATTHYYIKDYRECTNDCHRVLDLYRDHGKARIRMGQALIQLGQFEQAFQFYNDNNNNNNNNITKMEQELQTKAQKLQSLYKQAQYQLELEGDYATAKASFGKLLLEMSSLSSPATSSSSSTASSSISTATAKIPHIMLGAAKADLGLGLTDTSLRVCMQVLKQYPQLEEAYELRGMIAFHMCDFDNAMKYINESIRLDPDCERAKQCRKMIQQISGMITTAREHLFHRRFQKCQEIFSWIIEECATDNYTAKNNTQTGNNKLLLLLRVPPKSPLYALLYTERAEAKLRLKQYRSCLKDCCLVLYSQEDYVSAWICKFQAYHGLGQHEQALEEIIDLMYHKKKTKKSSSSRAGANRDDEVGWGATNERIRQEYKKADFLVRKIKRPNYYGLLGVSSIASIPEIKKAYKIKAKEYHPDRISSSSSSSSTSSRQQQEGKEKQTKLFQLLGEGLEVLCDDFKRQLYDEGYDLEAINERVAAAQHAAHR